MASLLNYHETTFFFVKSSVIFPHYREATEFQTIRENDAVFVGSAFQCWSLSPPINSAAASVDDNCKSVEKVMNKIFNNTFQSVPANQSFSPTSFVLLYFSWSNSSVFSSHIFKIITIILPCSCALFWRMDYINTSMTKYEGLFLLTNHILLLFSLIFL